MRCEEVTHLLYAHLDGELPPELRASVEAHLAVCAECRALAEREVKFRDRFVVPLRAVRAPAAVRRRVLGAVAAIDGGGASGRGWGLFAKVGGAAAVVLLGVLVAIQVRPESLASLSSIATSSATTHVKFNSGYLPLEVALEGNWRNTLENWFEDKVEFPVSIPSVRARDVQLVGGRLSHLRHVDAAYVVYLYRGDYASLFIFDGEAVRWAGGRTESLGGRRVHYFHNRGFEVMVWRQGPVGYALVTRAHQDLLAMVAPHISDDALSPQG